MKRLILLCLLVLSVFSLKAQTSKSMIKSWFETGDVPTQTQFWNFIDNSYNEVSDDILKAQSFPTIRYSPYTTKIPGKLYVATQNPTSNNVLKYDGYLYVTKIYNNNGEILGADSVTFATKNFTINYVKNGAPYINVTDTIRCDSIKVCQGSNCVWVSPFTLNSLGKVKYASSYLFLTADTVKADTLKLKTTSAFKNDTVSSSNTGTVTPTMYNSWMSLTGAELVARTIYVSLPNDPQTPGSDITGNGTQALPYATINKALKSIKPYVYAPITIQIDSGTFNFSIADRDEINYKFGNAFSSTHESYLTIKGSYLKENISFTLASTTIPYLFKVSGYTFSAGYTTGKFLGTSSALVAPIESNFNDSIYAQTGATTNNNLYQITTQLTIQSDRYTMAFNQPVIMSHLVLNFPALGSTFDGGNISFSVLNFNSTSGFGGEIVKSRIQKCYISTKYVNTTSNSINLRKESNMTGSVINNLGTRKTNGTAVRNENSFFTNNLISGYKNGVTVTGFRFQGTLDFNNYFFKDCENCFANPSLTGTDFWLPIGQLLTYNCTYFLQTYGVVSGMVRVQTKVGNNLTVFNPSSSVKTYSDPSTGWSLKYPGIVDLYVDNSSTASPIISAKYSQDKVGINKDTTLTWNATLNIGGDVEAIMYKTATDTMQSKAEGRAYKLKSDTLAPLGYVPYWKVLKLIKDSAGNVNAGYALIWGTNDTLKVDTSKVASRYWVTTNYQLKLTDPVTGTGPSVIGVMPVFSTVDNKVTGSNIRSFSDANGTYTAIYPSHVTSGTFPTLPNNNVSLIIANTAASGVSGSCLDLINGYTGSGVVQGFTFHQRTAAASRTTLAMLYGKAYNGYSTGSLQIAGKLMTNSNMAYTTAAFQNELNGTTRISGTNPLYFGGTIGNLTDYSHSIVGGTTSLIIKPTVDDGAAVKFQTSAGADFLAVNTTSQALTIKRGQKIQYRQTFGVDTDGDWEEYPDANGYFINQRISGNFVNTFTNSSTYTLLGGNIGNSYPGTYGSAPFLAVTYNHGGGGGFIDLWNNASGGSPKGFMFRQRTSAGNKTDLMGISGIANGNNPVGTVIVAGKFGVGFSPTPAVSLGTNSFNLEVNGSARIIGTNGLFIGGTAGSITDYISVLNNDGTNMYLRPRANNMTYVQDAAGASFFSFNHTDQAVSLLQGKELRWKQTFGVETDNDWKVFANNTDFYIQKRESGSWVTKLQVGNLTANHNSLTGLQGGVTNEYYHLHYTLYDSLKRGLVGLTGAQVDAKILNATRGDVTLITDNYDASTGQFPSTGSGTAGAILRSDYYVVGTAGTIADKYLPIGSELTADVDNPGQDINNWIVLEKGTTLTPVAAGSTTKSVVAYNGTTPENGKFYGAGTNNLGFKGKFIFNGPVAYSSAINVSPSGGVLTLDGSQGNVFIVNVNSTISNIVLSNFSIGSYYIEFNIVNGSYVVTYGSSFIWQDGAVPISSRINNAKDCLFGFYNGTKLISSYMFDVK